MKDSLLGQILDTQLDYARHPKKYPFYVMGIYRYNENVPYKFGVTDVPEGIVCLRDPDHFKAFINVQDDSTPSETAIVAKELAELMNKAHGKKSLPQ